jgi:hypothetical protein
MVRRAAERTPAEEGLGDQQVTNYGLNNDRFDDVIGLDRRLDVMFYTVKSFSRAHGSARNVVYCRRSSDIKRCLADGDRYDRIVIGDDAVCEMSVEALRNMARMSRGLLCFFVTSAQVESELIGRVSELYPFAEVRGFDTDVGRVVMCDASGEPFEPGKFDHAFAVKVN